MTTESRLRKFLRESLMMGLLIVGVLAARSTLADHYYVPSASMEHTLIAGDRVVVDKRAYGLRIPFTTIKLTPGSAVARGDVVIFDSPRDGTRLIKRIVAVGGDEVVLRDGHLTINGVPLAIDEDNAIEAFGDQAVRLNLDNGGGPTLALRLEHGTVLAIGDNRGNSVDGRMFGPVPENEIYGRAIAVYFRKGDGFSWLNLRTGM